MFKKINIQEKSVVVELKDKGETYKGIAKIHPDDVDFQSKETGIQIATMKAKINRHDKIAKARNRQIQKLMKEIKILEQSREYHIAEKALKEEFLQLYIDKKDAFYKQIRKIRSNPNSMTDTLNSIENLLSKLKENKDGKDKE